MTQGYHIGFFPTWICFQTPNNVHFVHWIDELVHDNQNRFQSKRYQNLHLVAPMQVLCSERGTCFFVLFFVFCFFLEKRNHLKISLNVGCVKQNWEEPQNLGYLYLNVLSGLSRQEGQFVSGSPSHSYSWETCFQTGTEIIYDSLYSQVIFCSYPEPYQHSDPFSGLSVLTVYF